MAEGLLAEWHAARGGVSAEGAPRPRHYGDPAAEYRALRAGAGLWERGDWGRRRLTGGDRLGFLQKYVTQDVGGLTPGRGAYACTLTVKGKMVSDLWIFAREEDALVLVPPAGQAGLFEHLGKYALFDDVEIEDLAPTHGLLALWGPRAGPVIEAALGATPPDAAPGCVSFRWEGAEGVAVRDDVAGVPEHALLLPAEVVARAADALAAAGAVPAGEEAVEQVRVEAGRPLYGVDMDERTIPVEAGLEARAVSYEKGCYVGQETIARIAHRGRVNRHLVGYRLPGEDPVAPPVEVFSGGKAVGWVTSSVRSPRLDGAPIGIGLCHRKAAAAGTEVGVGAADGPTGTVTELPFEA